MWICKMALNAPVPAGWTAHNDGEGNTYYYHDESGASSWDHPSDPYFRTLLRRCRRLKVSASKGAQSSQAAFKANEDLNAQLDKLKGKYNELKDAAAKVGLENESMTQRCAAMEAELAQLRQQHAAEIDGLRKVHVELRGKNSSLSALEHENSELKRAAEAAAEELKRYRTGEAVDLRARVSELEKLVVAANAQLKTARHEVEELVVREGELQGQLSKAHSTTLHDKTHINKLVRVAEEQQLAADVEKRALQEQCASLQVAVEQMRQSAKFTEQRLAAEAAAAKSRLEQLSLQESAELKRNLERVTRELERAQVQAGKTQQLEQQETEARVLAASLQEAASRAERLSDQLRKAEAQVVDVQRQLGDALNRCTAAEEKAVERGEQERRQRERAEATSVEILSVRAELDLALSKRRLLEAEVEAKNAALIDRDGAMGAKVEDMSERLLRLSSELEAERARTAALGREVATAKDEEIRAWREIAAAEQRAVLLDKQTKALVSELADTKAAVVRAEVALQSMGGGVGGDVAAGIAAMQNKLLDAHGELRAQGEKMEMLETARLQAVAACNKLQGDLHVCKDSLTRSQREVAEQTAALASERAAAHRFRANSETERLKIQQQIEALERQCKDLGAWAQGSEDKVLALTAKCEQAQQKIKVLTSEVEALRDRASVLRTSLDAVRVAKAKAEGDQRSMIASFRHEIRSLERQLAEDQLAV